MHNLTLETQTVNKKEQKTEISKKDKIALERVMILFPDINGKKLHEMFPQFRLKTLVNFLYYKRKNSKMNDVLFINILIALKNGLKDRIKTREIMPQMDAEQKAIFLKLYESTPETEIEHLEKFTYPEGYDPKKDELPLDEE